MLPGIGVQLVGLLSSLVCIIDSSCFLDSVLALSAPESDAPAYDLNYRTRLLMDRSVKALPNASSPHSPMRGKELDVSGSLFSVSCAATGAATGATGSAVSGAV